MLYRKLPKKLQRKLLSLHTTQVEVIRQCQRETEKWEAGDVLWVFKFFRVGDEALDGGNDFQDSAALTALTAFSHIDKHYTYTLPQEADQSANQDRDEDGNMRDDNSDGGSEHEASDDVNLESAPSFVQIN